MNKTNEKLDSSHNTKYIQVKDINRNDTFNEYHNPKEINEGSYVYGDLHDIFPYVLMINPHNYDECVLVSGFNQLEESYHNNLTYNLDCENTTTQLYNDYKHEEYKHEEHIQQIHIQGNRKLSLFDNFSSDTKLNDVDYDVYNTPFNSDPIFDIINEECITNLKVMLSAKLYNSSVFRVYVMDKKYITECIIKSFDCLAKLISNYRYNFTNKNIWPEEQNVKCEILDKLALFEKYLSQTYYMIHIYKRSRNAQYINEGEFYGNKLYDTYKKVWLDINLEQLIRSYFANNFPAYAIPPYLYSYVHVLNTHIKNDCISMYKSYVDFFNDITSYNDVIKGYIQFIKNIDFNTEIKSQQQKTIVEYFDNITRNIYKIKNGCDIVLSGIKVVFGKLDIDEKIKYYHEETNGAITLYSIEPL